MVNRNSYKSRAKFPERVTPQFSTVLNILVSSSKNKTTGYDIMRETGLNSGTVYPILHRMEEAGWLKSKWESVESPIYRPFRRRVVLQITAKGLANGKKLLS